MSEIAWFRPQPSSQQPQNRSLPGDPASAGCCGLHWQQKRICFVSLLFPEVLGVACLLLPEGRFPSKRRFCGCWGEGGGRNHIGFWSPR